MALAFSPQRIIQHKMSIFRKQSSNKRNPPEGVESNELHDDEMTQGEVNLEEIPMTDKYSQSDKKESTRSHIAQLYVWAFFAVIVAVFVIGCCSSFTVDEYKDMLVTVSGVLSGPLGFIVGYYFKASKE